MPRGYAAKPSSWSHTIHDAAGMGRGAWAPPLPGRVPATLLSRWTSRHPAGASRGLNAASRAARCINRAPRLHQPALLAASASGDALPGSARTDRHKHPGATLGACPGATRTAHRPGSDGSRKALHYFRPAPVAGSMPPRAGPAGSMPYHLGATPPPTRRACVRPGGRSTTGYQAPLPVWRQPSSTLCSRRRGHGPGSRPASIGHRELLPRIAKPHRAGVPAPPTAARARTALSMVETRQVPAQRVT